MANAVNALKASFNGNWRSNDFVVANSYIFLNSLIIKSQGLLIALVVTFSFGIAGYGSFQFSLSTAVTIAATISLGLPSILSVQYASGRRNIQSNITKMRFTYLLIGVILGAVVLTSLLAFTNLFSTPSSGIAASKRLQIPREFLTYTLFIWVPILSCSQISTAALTGLKRFGLLCRLGLFRIGTYLTLLGLKLFLDFRLVDLLLLFIVIDFSLLVLMLTRGSLIAPISFKFVFRFTRTLIRKRDFLSIIRKTSLANVGIIVALWSLQRYLIFTPGGAEANGFYNLVLRVSSALGFMPGIFAASIIPVLTSYGIRSRKFRNAFRIGLLGYFSWSFILLALFLPFNEQIILHFGSTGVTFIHYKWLILSMASALILNTFVSNVLLAGNLLQDWVVSDYILSCVIFFGLLVFAPHNSPLFNVFLIPTFAYTFSSAYGTFRIRRSLNVTGGAGSEFKAGHL
jgi:hypothetical protein